MDWAHTWVANGSRHGRNNGSRCRVVSRGACGRGWAQWLQVSRFSLQALTILFCALCCAATRQDEEDFQFEEELSRNPYSVKTWWQYLEFKSNSPAAKRNAIYERALKVLPGSYKLWHAYLSERRRRVRHTCPTSTDFEAVNNAFERSLVFMHKMPVIWLEYCQFLMVQRLGTRTRHAFDRALKALPITQHERVWPLYIKFVKALGVWQTAVKVYRRFMMFDSTQREEYVDYLLGAGQFDEAAQQLAVIVNDSEFKSLKGRTKHDLWMQLCSLLSQHPEHIKGIEAEPVIRSGLRQFSDEVGRLWCALADYHIRLGHFERARDIYEEGCQTVLTVRDFSMIFDAYTKFEETMVTAKMEMADDSDDDESDDDGLADLDEDADDVELRLQRLAHLMDRRPILLSSVLLRQNPHNVNEWIKRVGLFAEQDPAKAIRAYTEACKTVDPRKAVGRLNKLWCDFARFYEKHGDVANARVIFQKATEVPFKATDDLASVWCEWGEMELRNGAPQEALRVLQQGVQEPPRRRGQRKAGKPSSVQGRVHTSVKLWSFYLDVEEAYGTLDTAKAAYDRCMELKVATPALVLNYARMLEERSYFEESFRVYEKGVALFTFPHVKEIWLQYLTKFVDRYGGRKLERARDLFEQAVDGVPEDDALVFYALYAELEEKHGLIRHMMAVFDRATAAVGEKDKYRVFLRYIRKAEEFYGVTRTREIYERAVEVLPDHQVKDICLRFAEMERQLGEIDRARAVFVHASQFCDPRTVVTFWKQWHDFEIAHGNEDTFRDMLRLKRSVQAQYSQVNYMVADMINEVKPTLTDAQAMAEVASHNRGGGAIVMPESGGSMGLLEAQAVKRSAVDAGLPQQVRATSHPPTPPTHLPTHRHPRDLSRRAHRADEILSYPRGLRHLYRLCCMLHIFSFLFLSDAVLLSLSRACHLSSLHNACSRSCVVCCSDS